MFHVLEHFLCKHINQLELCLKTNYCAFAVTVKITGSLDRVTLHSCALMVATWNENLIPR